MMGATTYSIAKHEGQMLRKERQMRGFSVLRTWASVARERLLGDNIDIELSMYDLIDDITNSEKNIESMLILDAAGQILIHQNPVMNNTLDTSELSKIILAEKAEGIYRSEYEGKTVYHLYAPIIHQEVLYGVARIDINDRGVDEVIKEGVITLIIIASIILALGIILTIMFVVKITEPIHLLVDGAKVIGRGDLTHKINYVAKNEIGRLAVAFDRMTENLQQAQEDIIKKTLIERQLKSETQVLQKMATTDELTGLLNKRQFNEDAENYIKQAQITGASLVIMMLDMDKFKMLNDTVGHAAGDVALKDLAKSILKNIRIGNDNAYRIGGDEFIILTLGPSKNEAEFMSNRIDTTYDDLKASENMTTISFGIVEYNGTDPLKSFFEKADAEMYRVKRAKGAGR
jgi:diguanylate cyclase (GGDEF)-like protein